MSADIKKAGWETIEGNWLLCINRCLKEMEKVGGSCSPHYTARQGYPRGGEGLVWSCHELVLVYTLMNLNACVFVSHQKYRILPSP